MADNYLEQRMEDLRAGRLKQQSGQIQRAGSSPKRGYIQFPFPPRRVLIVGRPDVIGVEIVRSYLRAGCRVAVFDNSSEPGERMAKEEGIRFSKVDICDEETLQNAFEKLLKAWLDVDVVINCVVERGPERFEAFLALLCIWNLHRKQFPIPTDYGGRIINVVPDKTLSQLHAKTNYGAQTIEAGILMEQRGAVTEFHAAANFLSICGENSDNLAIQTARTCLFLSLPGNECISAETIRLTK